MKTSTSSSTAKTLRARTYTAKAADQVGREWFILDGTDQVLGRMATRLARVLMGKHKPTYTPHCDMGDFVVLLNADKIRVTGRKAQDKNYQYYTGWVGGLKTETYSELMDRDPGRVIKLAVRRMLPKTKLGRQMLRKLKIYRGTEHPHVAQKPRNLELARV